MMGVSCNLGLPIYNEPEVFGHSIADYMGAQDVDMLDRTLPDVVRMFVWTVVQSCISCLVICIATPAMLVILPPVTLIYVAALVGPQAHAFLCVLIGQLILAVVLESPRF
jgi:hypothetical protein